MIGQIAERWLLVVGTWALAIATIYLALDTRWSSEKQLRAYVYVNPDELYHVDGKGVLQVYSKIGNSGQTPAVKVERFAQIEVLPPTENPPATKSMLREIGVTVLGPRTEIVLIKNWSGGQLNPDQSRQIRNGDLRVYVFGKVFYDDVVGGRWELHFCNAYFGSELASRADGSFGYTGWQAKPCENGNELKERELNRHGRGY